MILLQFRLCAASILARWPFKAFARDQLGVTAIEYAIIAGIIVTALIASTPTIGPQLVRSFTAVSSEL